MNFKSVMRKTAGIMALTMTFNVMSPIINIPDTVEAASIRLSKKNVTIKVGQTITLKVKGTKKKVKWSSNKSSVAKVTQKGKVTGKKAGSAKITAKVKGKKLICKITVKSKAKKPAKTNIPVKTKDPLVNETSTPQKTNVPDGNKNPNRTRTPIETVKPIVTIVPNITNTPVKTKDPLVNETSTPQKTNVPVGSKNPNKTQSPIGTMKPNNTLTPIITNTPNGHPINLALNFYLDPFDPEKPNSQFVNVNFANHTKEDVYIETEAYMTTKGVNYPAMICDTKEGYLEKIEPTEENDSLGKHVMYDSKEYVMGNYTDETFWLKSDENSTFTFFIRIGDKRYRATINYDQRGAIFTEASDTDVLEPFATNTPSTKKPVSTDIPKETIAPIVTQKPKETLVPVETKTPVNLPLSFYLDPFDPEAPNAQFVHVHLVNHTKEDVYIETEAYMTTKGINYPAMIFNTKEGYLEKVEPVEEDNTDVQLVTYDTKEYVMGNYTDDTFWLKSDENSTFTFFFRIGNKRYHATINYDQGGAIFTEASDTDVLQPLVTSTPQKTIAPVMTEKPKETIAPVQTKTPVKLALNFYLDPFDPEAPNAQFVNVHLVNHTKEDVYIETEAYMTTKGVNYPAMILGSKEGYLEKVVPVEEDNTDGQLVTYDSKEYVMENYTDDTLWLKSDENSTFTFFFRIGDKRYHATINYDQGGAIFTEASDTDMLEPIVSYTPIKE